MGSKKVIAISGGVGGAKLSQGLAEILAPGDLTIIVNTGDDSEHYGLFVCPDIDTQIYTLAGLSDTERGWGRHSESWHAMNVMRDLGEDIWFNLGDRDLGLNLLRTMRMARGDRLTDIVADIAAKLGLTTKILPMCDELVSTQIRCEEKDYDFHEWFVKEQCKPKVESVVFRGAEQAQPSQEVMDAFTDPELSAVIICPSNPYLSIAPVLAVSGIKRALLDCQVPVIGVTPVIAGEAVKGPTAEMMEGFGVPVTADTAAAIHAEIYSGYIVDERDADRVMAFEEIGAGLPVKLHDTLMIDLEKKKSLASSVLDFAEQLGGQ